MKVLLKYPSFAMELIDQSLSEVKQRLSQLAQTGAGVMSTNTPRFRLTSMPFYLDKDQADWFPSNGRLRTSHAGMLVSISGIVMKTGPVQTQEAFKTYVCTKCGHSFAVQADLESPGGMYLPISCPNELQEETCKGKRFLPTQSDEFCHTDYQEIRIQTKGLSIDPGGRPEPVIVILYADLVDICHPGEKVEITGIVMQRWNRTMPGQVCQVELILLANSVFQFQEVLPQSMPASDDTEVFHSYWSSYAQHLLLGRNSIIECICPQIHGLFIVKLAMLLMLIGAPRQESDKGKCVRGEIHCLLIGDPSTGKSQFMKHAAKLSPRSVVTSGAGSSRAGLTASAVKENGTWSLEAGALLLAHGGLCCIDEFDGLRPQDHATVHEAMEQQTISIAKAGFVTTLQTRTSVLALVNPSTRYKLQETLEDLTTLSGPLISRFDILLTLRDTRDPHWDEVVSDHVLGIHQGHASGQPKQVWNVATLQRYIRWVKACFNPVVSREAETILQAYYQQQRQAFGHSPARVTIRMLESLIRISQAHARLMARSRVLTQDAVVACMIVDYGMQSTSLFGLGNALHSDFPKDPEADYQQLEWRLKQTILAEHISIYKTL
eukprot:jgi/Botrbrau1/18431/Bobra.0072s0022.4